MLGFDDGYPKPTDYPIHGIDVSKYQGDDRLERGREQRREVRLDQGDRRRRPSRRALPGQLAGRQARRHPARRLSLRLLVPAADRGSRPGSSRTCRSRPTRCRRCSTSSRRPNSQTCRRHLERDQTDRRHEGDARRDGAPLRQAADHLHHRSTSTTRSSPAAPSPIIRSGCARPSTIRRCATATATGSSGNTRPTASCRASTAKSTATCSTAITKQWQAFLDGPQPGGAGSRGGRRARGGRAIVDAGGFAPPQTIGAASQATPN